MSKASHARQLRRKAAKRMGGILAANGHPIGQAPPILRPGQKQIDISMIGTENGPGLLVTIDGVQTPIALGDAVQQLGVALIGSHAQWKLIQAQQRPEMPITLTPEAEKLLDEAIQNVGGESSAP